MKFILFLTVGIGCFATFEAADPTHVAYQLALGPLELFLNLEENKVEGCYDDKKAEYEKNLEDFNKTFREKVAMIDRRFTLNSIRKGYMSRGCQRMHDIYSSLKNYLPKLKEIILKKDLVEAGKTMWEQRLKLKDFYNKYKDEATKLKKDNKDDYLDSLDHVEKEFEKILNKIEGIINYILECLESKGVTYIKEN